MTLAKIAAYIERHSFHATILEDSVFFLVPYVAADGSKGFEEMIVRTYAEARTALGY